MLEGDSLDLLGTLAPQSIDALVTDPPYGIDFQGERWDGSAIREAAARLGTGRLSAGKSYQAWTHALATAALGTLKPGAHLLAFGSPRTVHRLACGIEEASLELRDCLIWLYGTGLPKSRRLPGGKASALKPAWEPILLARKPLDAPLEPNLATHGTGALSADACRIEGRFPANVLLARAQLRRRRLRPGLRPRFVDEAAANARVPSTTLRRASRLFYYPKASRSERDAGCKRLPARALDLFPNAKNGRRPPPATNPHPTVKPLALMRCVVRLTTPPGGLVLDPFCGSGSTGCAAVLERRRFLGIEREAAYAEIARARIAHWQRVAAGGELERARASV